MPQRLRSSPKPAALGPRTYGLLLLFALGSVASSLVACSDDSNDQASSGGSNGTGASGSGGSGATGASGGSGAAGASGGTTSGSGIGGSGKAGASGGSGNGGSGSDGSGEADASGGTTIGSGIGGSGFNQCGVAAPLPADTGQCTVVGAPTITDFDDYAGGEAASHTYYVNAEPPAADAVLGGILHIGDGSDTDGETSTITTEMVTGVSDAGYALQLANTNATNWGGLLMFYFIGAGSSLSCLDAQGYGGIEFSIKGSSPSGRYGVSLSMLETIPHGDDGLCENSDASDCKDANVELSLPADAETWVQVQLPWGSFTPGVGSAHSCVPVTGQNIVRLVIQPFMNYPPPDYTFEAGPYSIAVDDVRFY